jgi:hypothetical protein
MKVSRIFRLCSVIPLSLVMTLAACNNGPKTYEACVLNASRNAKNYRQFQVMSEDCRDKFSVRFQ